MPAHSLSFPRLVCLAALAAVGLLAFDGAASARTMPAAGPIGARAAAATVELTAVADTFVSSARPATTFGGLSTLEVDSTPRKSSLLRFSLAGVDRPVERATLSLQVVQGSRSTYDVRSLASGTWGERSVTYRTAPAAVGAAAKLVAPTAGRRVTVDVTSLVKPGATVELAIAAAGGANRLVLSSREAGAAAPRLSLELQAVASPPPPPPPLPPPPPPPPAGTNAYKGRIGVASASIYMEPADQLAHLRRARDAGLTWVREDFYWGAHERSPGVWNWQLADTLMRNAATVGVDVLGVIAYSAEWAASGPTAYHPPTDPAAYARFCSEVVKRYGPGGTFWRDNPALTPRPLTAVEIWNEPWLPYFWRDNPDPAAYVRLVRSAATAIRAANPNVKILVSADIFSGRTDTTESLDWFAKLLPLDPALFRDLVDAYSVHLYVQNRDPRDATTPQRWRFDRVLMTRDLARAAGAEHPIWITEFGWSTFAGPADSVTEAKQAEYTRAALKLAVEQWGSIVERSFVYYLGKGVNDYGGGYAMHRPDGSAKPAWDVVTSLLAA